MADRAQLETTLQLNTTAFFATLDRWAEIKHLTCQEALRDRAKATCLELVKLSPPFRSLSGSESFGEQRRIGELAVDRQIHRGFRAIEELGVFKAPRNLLLLKNIQTAVSKGDADYLEAFLGILHITIPAQAIIQQPTEGQQNEMRDHRGRIPRGTEAEWYVVRNSKLKSFMRKKHNLVGKLKGGWAAAAAKFGVSLPKWITRHTTGDVVDKSGDIFNPQIRLRNPVSYASLQDSDLRIVAIALRNQTGKMERQIASKERGDWERAGGNK